MNEKQLIANLQAGSNIAFKEVVNTYQNQVLRKCMSFVTNIQDAEDLCQEVFIEVFRSVGKFREESKFSTWIYKIATTKSLESIRYKDRKKRAFFFQSLIGLEEERVLSIRDILNHPGQMLENKERAQFLFDQIDRLGDNQKSAFLLNKVEGMSQKEIAKVMNTSVSAIEALLYRAKKNLQGYIELAYRSQII